MRLARCEVHYGTPGPKHTHRPGVHSLLGEMRYELKRQKYKEKCDKGCKKGVRNSADTRGMRAFLWLRARSSIHGAGISAPL